MTNKIIENIEFAKKFFTQKELAKRWNVSEGTIINWRNKGYITFFPLPGATKILYPVDEINEHEKINTVLKKEDFRSNLKEYKSKRKTPVVSANTEKDWRI